LRNYFEEQTGMMNLGPNMPINFKKHLIVFTRYPEPGTTKTRLIPLLGAEGAADLQRKMTEHMLVQVKSLLTSRELAVEIRYDGGDKNLMQNWLGQDFEYRPQGSGDLGLRTKRSFEDAFRAGATEAVIIGTDIPEITDVIVQKAFNALKLNSLVLGPAKDGGYYLIGLQKDALSQAISNLFLGINWGADDVLEKTIKIAKHSKLSFTLLEVLEDVDYPEDLIIWKRSQSTSTNVFNPNRISVIIPTINEVDNIKKSLTSIKIESDGEIIVADGGSSDDTVLIAKSLGARVVNSSPPRARQMNHGAAEATGDVLLFLHADTRLPKNFDELILQSLKNPDIVAGAFKLRIDSDIPALRLIEHLANWRSRCLKTPYGDQAIFILSRVFHQVGGFPDIPIMEDFELVRRLRKQGEIATLPVPVSTSPRRWQNLGILKTTLINQLVIAAYFMGIAPEMIARWYRSSKVVSEKR
jgi:rSAM/selenodomain-associated transferase 2/rSAM/selenodomain-associated transferase 1